MAIKSSDTSAAPGQLMASTMPKAVPETMRLGATLTKLNNQAAASMAPLRHNSTTFGCHGRRLNDGEGKASINDIFSTVPYRAIGHVKEESTVAGVFGIQINLTRLQRAAYHAATTN